MEGKSCLKCYQMWLKLVLLRVENISNGNSTAQRNEWIKLCHNGILELLQKLCAIEKSKLN